MRIAVIGSGTANRELPSHLSALGGAQVQAFIVNPRLSVFAFTPYEELLVDLGYVDAAQSAVDQDCDAIMINSFADYGIEAAGAVLEVPVIGAGAATLAVAAAGDRRFAIVTVWPKSMAFIYEERLRSTGLSGRCVGIWHISPEDELTRLADDHGVMQRMQRRESQVVTRLAAACHAAQAAGAEAIALGCTCMAPIGAELQAQCLLPVYEPSRCGFIAAVAAAEAAVASPPVAGRCAVRNPLQIPTLIDGWCGAMQPAQQPCPVCIAD